MFGTVEEPGPYRGLLAFRQEDAEHFFGREVAATRLLESVRRQSAVVLSGPSGSGKTSLILAGLLPRLRAEGGWLMVDCQPGREPFYELAGVVRSLLAPERSAAGRQDEVRSLAETLFHDDTTLQEVTSRVLQPHQRSDQFLLVIDSLEQLFTQGLDASTRRRFLDVLMEGASSAEGGRLTLLLALRQDFRDVVSSYPPFGEFLQDQTLDLEAISRDGLRKAIEQPARSLGARFEPQLVERILDDVASPAEELPLLQFALTRLWQRRANLSGDALLTHEAYEAVGEVGGALNNYADGVLGSLDPAGQEEARRLFLQLVVPGEDGQDAECTVLRSELGAVSPETVSRFVDASLVVRGRDAFGQETVDLAHEVLIRRWDRLKGWTEDDRAFRRWRVRLRNRAYHWEMSGREYRHLLSRKDLFKALRYRRERPDELGEVEKAFIKASADVEKKGSPISAARRKGGSPVPRILRRIRASLGRPRHVDQAPANEEEIARFRLDVAAPRSVQVGRAFPVAVAVRLPGASLLDEDDLPQTSSGDVLLRWPEGASSLPVRLEVQAPDCLIYREDHVRLRIYPDRNLPTAHFYLAAVRPGTIHIVVAVHQEEDWLGSARVVTEAGETVDGRAEVAVESHPLYLPEVSAQTMGIPTDSYRRLRRALVDCGPVSSDAELNNVFVDQRQAPWRNRLPQADSIPARVDGAIAFLHGRSHTSGQRALVLFLQVLRDRLNPDDLCHDRIADLARELAEG